MRYRSGGFTLVELLVVIAIIGVLVALLLPAVQSAREAARRTQCTNHLKNLTLGMVNHESTYKILPSSGWVGHWVGDPDRGTGKEQPGGWFYSILPFIEQPQLHQMGKGLTGTAREQALRQRDQTPLSVANCPSRRTGGPYIRSGGPAYASNGSGGVMQYPSTLVAQSDYAASVGDERRFDAHCHTYGKNDFRPVPGFPPHASKYSGITFCGTAVRLRQITDGTSNTFALGERYIPAGFYNSGGASTVWAADDWSMYAGFQDDTVRSTYYDGRTPTHQPLPDGDFTPEQITAMAADLRDDLRERFGSAHPGGCIMSKVDGSVDLVEYDVDPEMFRQMGDRKDGGEVKQFSRR